MCRFWGHCTTRSPQFRGWAQQPHQNFLSLRPCNPRCLPPTPAALFTAPQSRQLIPIQPIIPNCFCSQGRSGTLWEGASSLVSQNWRGGRVRLEGTG